MEKLASVHSHDFHHHLLKKYIDELYVKNVKFVGSKGIA